MTKYNIYKLKYSIADKKSIYVIVKEMELNDDFIESIEKVDEDSDLNYYRISMVSGTTYVIGKNK